MLPRHICMRRPHGPGESGHPLRGGEPRRVDGDIDAARALYRQAWAQAGDDFEACVAAHYMARRQEDAAVTLDWNLRALAHADAAMAPATPGPQVYGSLYVNVGHAYELTGNLAEAQRFFALAAGGVVHRRGGLGAGAACDECNGNWSVMRCFLSICAAMPATTICWRIRAFA
ncbi:MAG: hypothetical protein R2838_09130 [Caldilineaceae bacterium]